MSSKSQREALVAQFRTITSATVADATRLMKSSNYRVEAAVTAFYTDATAMTNAQKAASSSSGSAASSSAVAKRANKDKLGAIFDELKDEDDAEGRMTIEGTMEYCNQLGISPEDVVLLPLSFYLSSPTMGTFTRQGFVDGWRVLAESATGNVDTIEGMQKRLPGLKEELIGDRDVKGELGSKGKGALYKRVYEYVYTFARPEGQRSLPLDTALAFWDLLLPFSPTYSTNGGHFTPSQLTLWKEYLTTTTNNRAVSKDTWSLFLDFTREIGQDFKGHDFDAAWPSVIDGFVEWARARGDQMES